MKKSNKIRRKITYLVKKKNIVRSLNIELSKDSLEFLLK